MIAIPAGSVIGGFMTPAGGPTNIVAINALEAVGIRVTFLDWMIIGYPIGLVCAILFALWICLFYKPEKISDAQATVLAHDIAKQIEDEMEYPGQVRVVVIRESRAVDVAK